MIFATFLNEYGVKNDVNITVARDTKFEFYSNSVIENLKKSVEQFIFNQKSDAKFSDLQVQAITYLGEMSSEEYNS